MHTNANPLIRIHTKIYWVLPWPMPHHSIIHMHLSSLSLQTKEVTNTSVKLEKQLLHPGHRYEARVRARASVGQWSDWSPVVTWKTEEGESKEKNVHYLKTTYNHLTKSFSV